jgi:hypothetical protein
MIMKNEFYAKQINEWSKVYFGYGHIKAKAYGDWITFLDALGGIIYSLYIKDGNLELKYGWGSEEVFISVENPHILKMVVIEIFKKHCEPRLIDLYEKNVIDKLPKRTNYQPKNIDFSKLTNQIFKDIFLEATEEVLNSEKVDEMEIKIEDDTLKIEFRVDCGRRGIHKYNEVKINKRGRIRVNLCEMIEGGGIEELLEEKLLKLLS